MKKQWLLAGLLLASFSVFAQQKEKAFSLGVKAGAVLSNLKATEDGSSMTSTVGDRLGATLGVFVKVPLGKGGFSLQPELNYANMGAKGKEDDGFGSGEVNVSAHYLQLPLLAQYGFARTGFHVYAGPQIGFLLSGKVKEVYTFNGQTQTDESDLKDDLKSTDVSAVAGVGYQFSRLPIRLDLRRQWGLSNLLKEADEGQLRFMSYQFTVGYVF